jgi:NAD(P)H-hydrate epimerase
MGAVDTTDAFVIALDLPSGLDATTGEPTGPHIPADLTVTLALPKTGLDHPSCGQVELADIGIPYEVYRLAGIDTPRGSFGMGYRIAIAPEPG